MFLAEGSRVWHAHPNEFSSLSRRSVSAGAKFQIAVCCIGGAFLRNGNSILEYVAAVADLIVARAAYRAACRRWPEAKVSLRQGARVIERSWEEL